MTDEIREDVCECERPEKGYETHNAPDGDNRDNSTMIAYCKKCDKPMVSKGD